MAKATIKMPDDFLMKLSKLGSRTDEIAEKALKAGGEIILSKTKGNLQAVVGKDTKVESRSTGELVSALGLTGVRQDRNGNSNIKLGFSEPRKSGESNAKIANILEYGRVGQPPKPFLKPARNACKGAVVQKMTDTLNQEISKI